MCHQGLSPSNPPVSWSFLSPLNLCFSIENGFMPISLLADDLLLSQSHSRGQPLNILEAWIVPITVCSTLGTDCPLPHKDEWVSPVSYTVHGAVTGWAPLCSSGRSIALLSPLVVCIHHYPQDLSSLNPTNWMFPIFACHVKHPGSLADTLPLLSNSVTFQISLCNLSPVSAPTTFTLFANVLHRSSTWAAMPFI